MHVEMNSINPVTEDIFQICYYLDTTCMSDIINDT